MAAIPDLFRAACCAAQNLCGANAFVLPQPPRVLAPGLHHHSCDEASALTHTLMNTDLCTDTWYRLYAHSPVQFTHLPGHKCTPTTNLNCAAASHCNAHARNRLTARMHGCTCGTDSVECTLKLEQTCSTGKPYPAAVPRGTTTCLNHSLSQVEPVQPEPNTPPPCTAPQHACLKPVGPGDTTDLEHTFGYA